MGAYHRIVVSCNRPARKTVEDASRWWAYREKRREIGERVRERRLEGHPTMYSKTYPKQAGIGNRSTGRHRPRRGILDGNCAVSQTLRGIAFKSL